MAAEYGALLKWPVGLSNELQDLKGCSCILVLKIETRVEPVVRVHTIILPEDWTLDTIYEECFKHIKPIKDVYLKGSIKAFVALD